MRAKQLLVNELASLPGRPLFCTPEPTRLLAGGILGERKVWPIALAWSHRRRSLSPPGSATPPPPFFSSFKSVKEKKPLSQNSSHSADSIIQRYPLQQHVFLRSQVHAGEGREKKKILHISCKQQDMADCRFCVAIVKKNYTTCLTDINILWNSIALTWNLFWGMASSKRQLHV